MEEIMTMATGTAHGERNGMASNVGEKRLSAAAALLAQPTLVLGGTGKTGRRVAERLAARGLPVRVGSRSGEPPFDWEDRAIWGPALSGVDALYLTYYSATPQFH
jgi:phosphoglycerate dehydrogenase-like enzyme